MQVVTEGLALYMLPRHAQHDARAAAEQLLTYVSRDEARHTGYGIKYLSAVVPDALARAEATSSRTSRSRRRALLVDSRAGTSMRDSVLQTGQDAGVDPRTRCRAGQEREKHRRAAPAHAAARGPVRGFVIPTLRSHRPVQRAHRGPLRPRCSRRYPGGPSGRSRTIRAAFRTTWKPGSNPRSSAAPCPGPSTACARSIAAASCRGPWPRGCWAPRARWPDGGRRPGPHLPLSRRGRAGAARPRLRHRPGRDLRVPGTQRLRQDHHPEAAGAAAGRLRRQRAGLRRRARRAARRLLRAHRGLLRGAEPLREAHGPREPRVLPGLLRRRDDRCRRPAGAPGPARERPPPGEPVLEGNEDARGAGALAGEPPRPVVPRRAHRRPGPGPRGRDPRADPGARGRRNGGLPDDPRHGRGRVPVRSRGLPGRRRPRLGGRRATCVWPTGATPCGWRCATASVS